MGKKRAAAVRATESAMVPVSVLEREVAARDNSIELLVERFAELELALEDTGWMRQSGGGEREFSRDGLRKLIRICRLSYMKNPLINHAVNVQADYVWGQGANITAGSETVNDVVQAFLDDRRNSGELTGHAARVGKEIQLQVESNLFIVLFTNSSSGMVRVRSINVDEVADIVKNPQDSAEPWYYKRVWIERTFDPSDGTTETASKTAYYPDWKHAPIPRPESIGGMPVLWESPVYHVKTGGLGDMTFGVPEIYSAIDWARAVKEDLEDYATIRRALARFAWQVKTKGGPQAVAAAKTKLSTTLVADGYQLEHNPPPTVGSMFIGSDGADLQPVKTSGAQTGPDEGRRLWLMVAAGTGIPESILSGDATVGSYATAKSLDRPTELKMRNRQTLWADILNDLLGYVIDQAAIRPNGPLSGAYELDPYTGEQKIVLSIDPATNEPIDRSIDIDFPALLERDVDARITAIVRAATLGVSGTRAGTMDDRTLTRLLLSALGEDDIDQMLGTLFPDDATMLPSGPGEPPPPTTDPAMAEAIRDLREATRKILGAVIGAAAA
jgi:hypothetical protein